MDHHLLAFIGIATLLTVTPGADMALVTRNVLQGGLRAGFQTSAGILCGLVVWAALAVLGIAAVLAASATAFTILKIAGAAYLLYLGVMTLWRTRRSEPAPDHTNEPPRVTRSFSEHYRQGLLSNLLNAKVGIFYTTFLPQFVEPGDSIAVWVPLLAAIHIAMGVVWLAFYAWLVATVRSAVAKPAARRLLDRITGTVLVAFGLRLARDAR